MMPGMKPPMNQASSSMGQGQDNGMPDDQEDSKSGKLLALQNLLGSISEISDEEMRPYIENMQQQLHMSHENEEGDQEGMDDAMMAHGSDMNNGMGSAGPDIAIGVGAPPPSADEEDEEDEGKPKGFLAILAKKVAKK